MQVFSSGILGFILFARIWGGLGAGGLTVVTPLYLSEIAPAKSRGMIVSIYMVLLLSFLSLGKSRSQHPHLLLTDACRILHKLCCQCCDGCYQYAIPTCAEHPSNPRRDRLHLFILPVRYP